MNILDPQTAADGDQCGFAMPDGGVCRRDKGHYGFHDNRLPQTRRPGITGEPVDDAVSGDVVLTDAEREALNVPHPALLAGAVERILAGRIAALTQDRARLRGRLERALASRDSWEGLAAQRFEARADLDRLVADVRALADEWDRVRRPQLRACASDLRALLPTTGPSQADAEPQHTDGAAAQGKADVMAERGAPPLGLDWIAFMLMVGRHVDPDSAKAVTDEVRHSAWLKDRDASMRLLGAVLPLDDEANAVEVMVEAMVDVQDDFREDVTFHDYARAAWHALAAAASSPAPTTEADR